MDTPRHDTEDCWALRHKVHDLIENGTIAVSTPISQNIKTNPVPTHATGPSNLVVNMISMDKFSSDPSQLIGPLGPLVRVHLMKDLTPLVAPVNYSPSNPLVIGGPNPTSRQSLSQIMAHLTISSAPQAAWKPILIIEGGGA